MREEKVYELFNIIGRFSEFKTSADLIGFISDYMNKVFPENELSVLTEPISKNYSDSFPLGTDDKKYGCIVLKQNLNKDNIYKDFIKNFSQVINLAIEKIEQNRNNKLSEEYTTENHINLNETKTFEQEELDFYFTNSLDLLCIANLDGYFIKLSNEWENSLGYKIEELIGKKFLDFVHPDDLNKTLEAISQLSSKKQVLNFVNRYKRKDGSFRTIEWRSNPWGKLILAAARDITDRITMEQNLKESEERNKTIASLTADYVFKLQVTEKGEIKFVFISDNFYSITGRSKKDILTPESWKNFIHPDDYPRIIEMLQSTVKEGKLGEMECRSKVKGEYRWIHIDVTAEKDTGTSRVVSITGAVKDITYRKNIEIQLRYSEEKFLKAFMCTPDAVTISTCLTGKYIDVNDVFVQMTGYRRNEVIGKTANDLNLWFNNEDRELLRNALRENGHLRGFKTKFKIQSGEIKDCLLTGELIDLNNEQCSLLFIHDITEQKKAEEELYFSEYKFRSIFENSSIGIALINLDGKFLMANKSLCKILGYTTEEIVQKSFQEITYEADKNLSSSIFETILKGEIKEQHFNKRYIHKDGHTVWTEVSSTMIHDEKGKPLYFITHIRDISDRIIAENQIRESEEKFRIAFDNAPTGMSIITANGFKYLAVNPLLCDMFGYTKDEFLNNSIQLVTHPDDIERSDEWIKKKINNEPCEDDFEKRYIHKDGRIIWGLVRSQWIREENGSPQMAVTHILDITSRKLAEDALLESENRLKSIFRAAPVGIGTTINRIFTEANTQMCEMTGYNREELIGKSARIIYPSQEDYEFVGNEKYRQIQEIGTGTIETRWQTKGGKIINVLLSSSPIDSSDISKGITFTALDITERKLAERSLLKFQFSFEHAPIAVYWMNKEGRFIYVNKHACQSLNYSHDELLQMYVWDIDPAYSNEMWISNWNQYNGRDQHSGAEHLESLHKRKDNSLFPVEITSKHLWFENEELQISFVHDITDYKQAELMIRQKNAIIETQNAEYKQLNIDLQKSKEKAEESDRLKTAFLQNMSHEIRTPMNAIVGFSDLLQSELDDRDKIAKYTQIINQRSNDLLAIINDILDIAKIESGLLPVNLEHCNLNDLFQELDEFFLEHRKRMEKEDVAFIMSLGCDKKYLEIITDKVKLKQIFINLINNAFKFTKEGTIEGGCKIDENGKLVFYVSDTGIGIPADKQDIIFERFIQLNYSKTSIFSGTGLGLPIVKGLLSLLNGSIWLESAVGQGTTFYFTFEYQKSKFANDELANNIKGNTQQFKDKKILVVEDDYYNSLFIKEVLTKAGFQVLHTEYGNEAVHIVDKEKPDLVLMDIRLPDIDGYEAIRQIISFNPGQKIIAQTAYASQLDRQKAIDSGCSDYISKPMNRQQLLLKIASLFS